MDPQDCGKPGTALQENGQELPPQHTHHRTRTYSSHHSGQLGPGRTDERKPAQNNVFEEEDEEEVPYHAKMQFQEQLKHLAPEELGQIVDFIGRRCPEAFQEEDNDNAQLLLDNLDAPTFEEAREYVLLTQDGESPQPGLRGKTPREEGQTLIPLLYTEIVDIIGKEFGLSRTFNGKSKQ